MPEIASSDGVDLHVEHFGGAGPPLLMVHATGFCAAVWRTMASELADRFDCWGVDVRGHGRSGTPDDRRFHWDGTADDVLAVIDAHRPGVPWYGIGHSMGGASLLLAEQRRPGQFARLWVFEPIVFPPGTAGGDDLAEGAQRRRRQFASPEEALANYRAKPPMASFHPQVLADYLDGGFVADPTQPPGGIRLACEPTDEAEFYRMGSSHDAWDGLDRVQCRVQVLSGTTEFPGPATLAAPIAARLAHGTAETHPELSHFGPLEDPLAMARSAAAAFNPDDSASLSAPAPSIEP